MSPAEFSQACAEKFVAHCVCLDLDDALEDAAAYQLETAFSH